VPSDSINVNMCKLEHTYELKRKMTRGEGLCEFFDVPARQILVDHPYTKSKANYMH
jgi:hypothetical protein